jgi:hypothetical protein
MRGRSWPRQGSSREAVFFDSPKRAVKRPPPGGLGNRRTPVGVGRAGRKASQLPSLSGQPRVQPDHVSRKSAILPGGVPVEFAEAGGGRGGVGLSGQAGGACATAPDRYAQDYDTAPRLLGCGGEDAQGPYWVSVRSEFTVDERGRVAPARAGVRVRAGAEGRRARGGYTTSSGSRVRERSSTSVVGSSAPTRQRGGASRSTTQARRAAFTSSDIP